MGCVGKNASLSMMYAAYRIINPPHSAAKSSILCIPYGNLSDFFPESFMESSMKLELITSDTLWMPSAKMTLFPLKKPTVSFDMASIMFSMTDLLSHSSLFFSVISYLFEYMFKNWFCQWSS